MRKCSQRTVPSARWTIFLRMSARRCRCGGSPARWRCRRVRGLGSGAAVRPMRERGLEAIRHVPARLDRARCCTALLGPRSGSGVVGWRVAGRLRFPWLAVRGWASRRRCSVRAGARLRVGCSGVGACRVDRYGIRRRARVPVPAVMQPSGRLGGSWFLRVGSRGGPGV